MNTDEVRQSLVKYKEILEEFKDAHKSFQCLLSDEECKQDGNEWYQAKMHAIQDFLACVNSWLSKATETEDIDDVAPADSVSLVSRRSKESSRSSHSSALIVAEAEQAALKARYTALKEKHALDEKEQMLSRQMEQIRKQKETLEMEAELAAASAKVSVLKEGDSQVTHVDGMEDYFKKAHKTSVSKPQIIEEEQESVMVKSGYPRCAS